jgi:hypothetical protein
MRIGVMMMTKVEPTAAGRREVESGDTRRTVLKKAILIGLGAGTLVVADMATSAEPAAASVQGGWRWCGKCQGMFYPENGTAGRCPDGGGHYQSTSWYYFVYYEPTDDGGGYQRNWRWCGKCQGLFYAGNGTTGKCPAGDGHYQSVSADYVLNTLPGGQVNWRWCGKCQGLFYAGNGTTGKCPAGDGHYQSISADYHMSYSLT